MKRILFALVLAVVVTMLSVAALAAPEICFDIEEEGTLDGVYVITATITDEADFRGADVTLSFDHNIIIPVDSLDGSIPDYDNLDDGASYPFVWAYQRIGRKDVELTIQEGPTWVFNGENSEVNFKAYWTEFEANPFDCAEGFAMFDLYIKLADGKTLDDFKSTTFGPSYIKATLGDKYGYFGNEDATLNNFAVTNNVVPEAVAITIPVAAGDIVYLQDGTFATMEAANEAYEVPATVGYVAVNTGKSGQKTYYVDGTSATLVHTNGAVGSDTLALRDRTPVLDKDHGNVTEDRNGIRFKMGHNPATRDVADHEVIEVGFVMTAESAKTGLAGTDYVLDMALVEAGLAAKGVAFGNGRNSAFNIEDSEFWIIGATMYGIPISEEGVQTTIVSRPYYKVGESYVYGEVTKTCLYDIAKAIKDNEESWNACDDSMQEYINEIIEQVESWTEIVEDEVVIDISGLYN